MADLERFIAEHQATRQLDGVFLREVDETGGGAVEPLAALADRTAALLLGEPGSGKSHALRWLGRHLSVWRPEWVVHHADLVQHHEWSLESRLFDPIEAALGVSPVTTGRGTSGCVLPALSTRSPTTTCKTATRTSSSRTT